MTDLMSLAGGAVPLLRQALYCQLTLDLDALSAVAAKEEREGSLDARRCWERLACTAALLERAGWASPQASVALADTDELALAHRALALLAELEAAAADEAREKDDKRAELEAILRWQELGGVLDAVRTQDRDAVIAICPDCGEASQQATACGYPAVQASSRRCVSCSPLFPEGRQQEPRA